MDALPVPTAIKRDLLLDFVRQFDSCAVAFSAGVDSTVLAKAAVLALGKRAVAITGNSPSLAAGELEEARSLAKQIGIRHLVVETDEMNRAEYVQNGVDRCYHCKTELYTVIAELNGRPGQDEPLNVDVVFNGANVDDAGDYRPGMTAAAEHLIQSPLLECGINKRQIRQLAEHWQLPVWNKPATPCLSSRIAYGEEVTPERLVMIDRGEQILRELGLREVRVRYHAGDLARIEVPVEAIALLCDEKVRGQLAERFQALGFKFITLDLQGFRSGSHNVVVPIEILTHKADRK